SEFAFEARKSGIFPTRMKQFSPRRIARSDRLGTREIKLARNGLHTTKIVDCCIEDYGKFFRWRVWRVTADVEVHTSLNRELQGFCEERSECDSPSPQK